MNFIYGTKNKSKLEHMKSILKDLHITVEALDVTVTDVEETGNDILENAKIKALHYYKQVKKPIFSCDSGLYLEGVEKQDQPGKFIRRVNGKSLTDEEMLIHYSGLAKKYGGSLIAKYHNAICVVLDEEHIITYDGEELSSVPFKIVEKPHSIRKEGFPLDALSVEIKSNMYYDDLQDYSSDSDGLINGFQAFFKRLLTPEVTIEFDGFGEVQLELYPYCAPDTTKNFIHLIQSDYYNDKSVCRIVSKRLIQSGDPKLDPEAWTDDTPGYILNGEFNRAGFNNPLSFKRGTLGMAMAAYHVTDYATAGSFFIMTRDESTLDNIVPAFGRVTTGMDIIDQINDVKTHTNYGYDAPYQVIDITRIDVDTKGVFYDLPKEYDFKVINSAD
ncbi:MAG: peptidylprolyl isomerase [Clostridiales bacterium]|nr:peptidylprolyl isomerase [Clostridiales bacterium]